ncbi:hypothetical protein EPA93_37330 [Ktedonosporobacter rubrisoli]|uniref:PsbP C-terminal domain-containing protein n=1 Tax=Ktedonosporobacter rubrisoli TaxID=2509675 RepID=A0A4P6JZS1_KTERU|nr:hypothetical protein [Ktedonosporobacter rubrisoli]QBD81337.1 hypothetical protein EPA93_37330 [Ktedonosporobacter rubrisoli]
MPSPSSFKKLSDADLNVSLQYPADWTQESPQKTAASSVLGIHSSQQFGITFNVVRFSDTSSSSISDPNQINQVAISQFSGQQGVSNVQLLKPANSQPTIGGAKWVQAEAMVIATNGLKFHIATISVQHNKDYYNIQVFAPDDYYSEAVQKYIQPMLSSWQFLS